LRLWRYLKLRGATLFYIAVLLTSFYISTIVLSVKAAYDNVSSLSLPEENVYVIYDRKSSTPFTGLVPLALTANLSNAEGVLEVSPEVVVPVRIRSQYLVLRGVTPSFFKITKLELVEGAELRDIDEYVALVGVKAAEALGVSVGDRLIVLSVFRSIYVELEVVGVYRADPPLDGEVIAPLPVGQWLRGVDYSYVTQIRIMIDPERFDTSTITEIQGEHIAGGEETWKGFIPLRAVKVKPGVVGGTSSRRFMEGYLARYGLDPISINVASITTAVLAGLTIVYAAIVIVMMQRSQTVVFTLVGAKEAIVKTTIIMKLLAGTVLASVAGFLLAYTYLDVSLKGVKIVYHGIIVGLNPELLALEVVIVLALTAMGVAICRLDE